MLVESVIEREGMCARCGTPQRWPWPLILVVDAADTWQAVRSVGELSCGLCRAPSGSPLPMVLVDRLVDPVYVIAVRPGGHPGRELDGLLPPWYHRMLDAIDWPGDDGTVLDHPAVTRIVAARASQAQLDAALSELIGASAPADVLRVVAGNPELGTPAAATALDDLVTSVGLPPEGDRWRRAYLDFFDAADQPAAIPVFLAEREAGRQVLAEAGMRQMHWLFEHDGHPDTQRWDRTARSALSLLGFAGLAGERAHLLFAVGSAVDGRAVKSPEDVDWAIDCLRDSHDLATEMGAQENAAAAAENLAIALQSRRHGNLEGDTAEAAELLEETLRFRRAQGGTEWAQTATSLALTLTRLSEFRSDAALIDRAAALCREALPARPKDRDPVGWAFTAGTLAQTLLQAEGGPDRLTEAVALFGEVWPLFAARGATMNAHKARLDLCRALNRLASVRRQEVLHRELGYPADEQVLRVMQLSPGSFAQAEAPPELAPLLDAPPGPAELALLLESLALAESGLAQTRLSGDIERRSEYARIVAVIAQRRFGESDEAVDAVTAARAEIDHRFAPSGAWETAADLARLHGSRGDWPAARRAFDDCLAVREWAMTQTRDRETTLRHLRRSPALARFAAYSRVRCGDAGGAVELLERSRLQSYAEVSGDLARGSGGLLRSRSATVADIGRSATASCPLAYVVTTPYGSVVLVVRPDPGGRITVTAYESRPTSAEFFGLFQNVVSPELGLMSAQRAGYGMAAAVGGMAGPLGRVLQPVADALCADGVDRLLLIPTGPATAYPWSAARLTDPATGATVAAADLFVLTQAPSAITAGLSRQRAARSRDDHRVTVFADPLRTDARPLPGARDEAAMIAAAFPGRTTVHEGADATREALLHDLPQSWITHLACHGTNDWIEFSAMRLLLAGGDVTLADLAGLPVLPSRLVFLSACQTGHADLYRLSDEMIGLPYSILAGGAAAVVSTLWPIDDRITARLVGRFYAELAAMVADGREDVPLALHRAQQWLRAQGIAERAVTRDLVPTTAELDPHHWAAFVCHGT